MNLKSCGWCCGVFSAFACIMLLVISTVLRSDSRALPYARDDPHEREKAADNCLYAAIIYAGFIFVSVGCVLVQKRRSRAAQAMDEDQLHQSLLDQSPTTNSGF